MNVSSGRLGSALAAAVLTIASWLGLGAPGGALQQSEAGTREAANLETFDRAWELIEDRFWDPEFGGVDWDAVRDELRPEAAAASSTVELRRVLTDMVSRLGQSHFGVLPGPANEGVGAPTDAETAGHGASGADADQPACAEGLSDRVLAALDAGRESGDGDAGPGFDYGVEGGELLVTAVDEEGSAGELGVHPGWTVAAIDGQSIDAVQACLGADLGPEAASQLLATTAEALLQGDVGQGVVVRFVDGEGTEHTLDLERRLPSDTFVAHFGNLPPMQVRFGTERLEREGVEVGYIRFDVWMMPISNLLEDAMIEYADADGVIIDLRGNPGGVAGLSPGIAGYFVGERKSLGELRYRRDRLNLNVNPRFVTRNGERLAIYTGPLAILIDELSASTSEIFAAGLQDHGRARIFGERSAGAALPAVIEELPNGDLFMHAMADLVRPNGERIEGVGVEPDESVEVTREGLLQGVDEPLEAAVAWVVDQSRSPGNTAAPGSVGFER